MSLPIVLSYGAGTNSNGVLVGMKELGERPDVILFADTGGERPETYAHINVVNKWCSEVGFPSITIVKATGKTLYQDCIDRKALPAIAYGFKTCSLRWKVQPQEKWLKDNGFNEYVKFIGIDVDERHRIKKSFHNTRYPLIEWGWGRDECIAAIQRAGLPQPGKSACFFCPSSKKNEIIELSRTSPELFEKAVFLENNANLISLKGLGRRFSWKELVVHTEKQILMFDNNEMPCGCYDGD